MSNKRENLANEYRQLKKSIFTRTALYLFGAVVTVFGLYHLLFQDRLADAIVALLTRFVYQDYQTALSAYQRTIRNYEEVLFLAAIVLLFGVALRIYLNSFTKYFNEINKGIDALIEENTEDVVLSPELAETERKINAIKDTLAARKQEAALAEQRKNDLIVYLAHDLKTPLTSVIGYLTLLRDQPELSQELRCRYTGVALEKAERLEELINEFFEITRLNLTSFKLETETIHLSRMLEQISYEFRPILEEKKLSWRLEIEPDVDIVADPGRLERVFDNLIRNAVHYSDPETEILLRMQRQEKTAIITVYNHGETIPPDKLEHIFDQFFRMDASRTSETGGAGLGLAIAKEIIELHHGSIKASSEQNTIEFRVTLPTS